MLHGATVEKNLKGLKHCWWIFTQQGSENPAAAVPCAQYLDLGLTLNLENLINFAWKFPPRTAPNLYLKAAGTFFCNFISLPSFHCLSSLEFRFGSILSPAWLLSNCTCSSYNEFLIEQRENLHPLGINMWKVFNSVRLWTNVNILNEAQIFSCGSWGGKYFLWRGDLHKIEAEQRLNIRHDGEFLQQRQENSTPSYKNPSLSDYQLGDFWFNLTIHRKILQAS